MAHRPTLLALALVAGCHPDPGAPGSGALTDPTLGAPAVVVREVVTEVPEGGDGPDTVLLAVVDSEGEHPLEGPAIGGIAFQDGVLVLRPDRSLEMVWGERGSVIDRDVVFAPVVSRDGQLAAWAAERGDEQVLVVIDRDGGRAEAVQGVASIGAVAFEDAAGPGRRLAFVGAINGGVAGLWVARVDGSVTRCVTNCALRTGRPYEQPRSPLPDDRVRFDGDALTFHVEGAEQRLALPAELR